MIDNCGREINYMRISVTDRCNLRCRFCMPEGGFKFLNEEEILNFEELKRIIRAAVPLGINHFRITGGEPLVRPGITEFISEVKKMDGVKTVTMTTNGVLLGEKALGLVKAQIDTINVSLTSLDPLEYGFVTGKNKIDQVLEGIHKLMEYGIHTKINCVPLININEDNIEKLAAIAKKDKIDVRFIEMMPIGKGASFGAISNETIRSRLEEKYGAAISSINIKGNGPAVYYKFPDFVGNIGFISAKSHEFCNKCNRVRLTADGYLKLCLNYNYGINIKEAVRTEVSIEELSEIIRKEILKKPKHHNFNEKNNTGYDENTRFMAQIGG